MPSIAFRGTVNIGPNNCSQRRRSPNRDPNPNNSDADGNESCSVSEDDEENGSEKVLSPQPGSPLVEEESECDAEDRGSVPTVKRVKRSRIMHDSDDKEQE